MRTTDEHIDDNLNDWSNEFFDSAVDHDDEFDEDGNFVEKTTKLAEDKSINRADDHDNVIDTGSIEFYNVERTSDVTGKKVTNYVDNDGFCNAVIAWNEACRVAESNGKAKPPIPDVIGKQILMMAEGLSRRYNFRNYCVDHETEALTQRGWLSVNEINEDDIILSLDPADGKLKWSKIFEIFRNEKYDGLMHSLHGSGINALVTPGHKFLTKDGLKKIESINNENIILSGYSVDPINEYDLNKKYVFLLIANSEARDMLLKHTCLEYENTSYNKDRNDILQMIACLNGKFAELVDDKVQINDTTTYFVDKSIADVHYKGTIWCPRTEYGTFMCRRGGITYITGNTYLDEMRDDAVYMAIRAVKNFDPTKSSNAFGYFNRVMWQAMTTRIKTEKEENDIKMSLLKDPMYLGYTSETSDNQVDKDRLISVYDN